MDDQLTGPVSVSEAQAVVALLRGLAGRAAENHQATLHFVFSLTADSLADNVEEVESWSADDDE
jgi:hypothetical protein